MAAEISCLCFYEYFIGCGLWGRATSSYSSHIECTQSDLRIGGNWLIEGATRWDNDGFICLPIEDITLAKMAVYVLEWR